MTAKKQSPIAIYTTGGSLDKIYDLYTSEFIVGAPEIPSILKESTVTVPYKVIEFIRKDSLDITSSDRNKLKALISKNSADKVIVTHGTDTLHLTGQALSVIQNKVIVLTAAMQPASFKVTDTHFNIGCAFMAVQCLPPGTYIVMNGKVFDPFHVKKNFTKRCFEEV